MSALPAFKNPPQIGDVVHYVSYGTPGGEYGKECRAAVITQVDEHDDIFVGLCVLNPTGQFFNPRVMLNKIHGLWGDGQAASYHGGTWHSKQSCAEFAAHTGLTAGGEAHAAAEIAVGPTDGGFVPGAAFDDALNPRRRNSAQG
jgi:hypothetical protein